MQHTATGTCHICVEQYPIEKIEVCKGCDCLICNACSVDSFCESCVAEEDWNAVIERRNREISK
jgi:hypothetical protein